MIVKEIIGVFEDMRSDYNSEDFDFIKTHAVPLFFVEGYGLGVVSDLETFDRVFESIINCNKYLDLPKIDFYPKSFLVMSDALVVASVRWEFSNHKKKVGLILEVGYVFQKKDNTWKINVVLHPTWREPTDSDKTSKNIKKSHKA